VKTQRVELPKWSARLWEPHRYKVVKSGRGAGKSWTFATALLLQGIERPLRIVCGRETQQSLVESVHQLLADTVKRYNLGSHYRIQNDNIHGLNGTKFIFKGLHHNPDGIKSLEGCDRLWLEEANSLSKESWKVVKPTVMRKEGSEIWVSYNPRLATEETHKMFWVDEPPTGTWRYHTSWRENPWFPEGLRIELEDDKRKDMAQYLHVWEGECTTAIEGAVYGKEMAAALAEGRITKVSIDRTRAVDTFWDLGYGDSTAIWFAQALPGGTFHFVDYLENSGEPISWYLIEMQKKGYLYGTDWLPHDGVDAILHKKLSSGDRSRSIEQIMRASGRRVRIAPKLNVITGINAVRSMLPNCRFDEERCARGLDCLRMYQWGAPSKTGVERSEPLHDQYSHGADAARTAGTSLKTPTIVREESPFAPHSVGGPDAWMA
jgi:phage terminase large subunit